MGVSAPVPPLNNLMKLEIIISDIQTNDEEHDALLGVVAGAQAARDEENLRRASGEPPLDALPAITPESYLGVGLQQAVDSYARQAFDRSVMSLSMASRTMPYADRKALIASIKSQLV